jgi:hypothetical protein
MHETNDELAAMNSRVDAHAEELAKHCPNPRQLAGRVAGTSEETAALFSSGRTLAADSTGEGSE